MSREILLKLMEKMTSANPKDWITPAQFIDQAIREIKDALPPVNETANDIIKDGLDFVRGRISYKAEMRKCLGFFKL